MAEIDSGGRRTPDRRGRCAPGVAAWALIAATLSSCGSAVDAPLTGTATLTYTGRDDRELSFALRNGSAVPIRVDIDSYLFGFIRSNPSIYSVTCEMTNGDLASADAGISHPPPDHAVISLEPGDTWHLKVDVGDSFDLGTECEMQLMLEDQSTLTSEKFVP